MTEKDLSDRYKYNEDTVPVEVLQKFSTSQKEVGKRGKKKIKGKKNIM